mgnify:CR=1 FL=1
MANQRFCCRKTSRLFWPRTSANGHRRVLAHESQDNPVRQKKEHFYTMQEDERLREYLHIVPLFIIHMIFNPKKS